MSWRDPFSSLIKSTIYVDVFVLRSLKAIQFSLCIESLTQKGVAAQLDGDEARFTLDLDRGLELLCEEVLKMP
jgi:hypothetical protein